MQSTNVINDGPSYETKSLDRTREKILHCYGGQNSVGFNALDPNFTNTPFRATLFWNNLVDYFRTHIEIKQKRVRLKYYDSCFSGSEAVTLVYNYLRQPRHQTNNKTISRENAVKVCKLLLKTQVIEPVNILKQDFEDSTSKLYRISATKDDVPWLDAFQCQSAPNKPQSEILRPKNELNSTKCNQKVRECSVKSTAFSERNRFFSGKLPSCQKEKKRPFLPSKFNFFHRTSKDLIEDNFSSSSDDEDDKLNGRHVMESRMTDAKFEKNIASRNHVGTCAPPDDRANSSETDYMSSLSSLPSSSTSAAPSSSCSASSSSSSSPLPAPPSSPLNSDPSDEGHADVSAVGRRANKCLTDSGTSSSTKRRLEITLDTAINDIVRQTILSRLLQTVDLSFLESLVHPIADEKARSMTLPPKGCVELLSHKTVSGDYCCLLLKKVVDSESSIEEVWWTVSIKLLNLLSEAKCVSPRPSSRGMGARPGKKRRDWLFGFHCLEERKSEVSLRGDEDIKSMVFSTIVGEHRALPEPLWSVGNEDLHVQILNLMDSRKYQEVKLALQLSLHLLPWRQMDHVVYLLLFMRLCRMDASFDCKKMLENKFISTTINTQGCGQISLVDCFEGCIIRGGALSIHRSSHLLSFMIDNLEELCSLPLDVKNLVNNALTSRKSCNGEFLPEIATYCRRTSPSEYEERKTKCTEESLVQLMNHIIDSTDLSLKEKKSRLKNFAKHHSILYEKYFRNVL